jgi:hypothetical protein
MTAFTVGDDASSGGGGLSANAMALGADTNLVFTMRATGVVSGGSTQSGGLFSPDGLLVINRPFKLNKTDAALKAKVGTSHVGGATGIAGAMTLTRNGATVANFPFTIPPAGQIAAPAVSATIVNEPAATLSRDITKLFRFNAVYRDALGATTIGPNTDRWLGVGSSTFTHSFELSLSSNPANNTMGDSAPVQVQLVGYDKLADKEIAPRTVDLWWNMGPFTQISSIGASASGASGNLPQGTIINLQKVHIFDDGSMITQGPQSSFTIGAAGGCSFNPGGWAGYLEAGNTRVYARDGLLYKLSTHSSWVLVTGNQNVIVANTFAAGGVSLPGSSITFSGVQYVTLLASWSQSPIWGPNADQRFNLRVYTGGRLVSGQGAVYDGSGGMWPYPVSYQYANDYQSGTIRMIIGESYENQHENYASANPRGDQYFTAGQKIKFDLLVPTRANVQSVDVYVREFTTTNGSTTVESNVPYKLIYSGPAGVTAAWLGAVINANATPPAANTTDNYPAQLNGSLSWDTVSGAEDISVLPGDQLICSLSASLSYTTNSFVQVSVPVEFLG